MAAAPFLWGAGEWSRGHLLGRFPWGLLGYSQYLHLNVIQIAELAGVYGVSLVIVAVNAALAGVLVLSWRGAIGGLAVASVVVLGTLAFGAWRLPAPASPAEATVAVMQPSTAQPLTLRRQHAA